MSSNYESTGSWYITNQEWRWDTDKGYELMSEKGVQITRDENATIFLRHTFLGGWLLDLTDIYLTWKYVKYVKQVKELS